jgi:hypothetical protein
MMRMCPCLGCVFLCTLQVPDGPDGQTAEMRAGDMMVVKYTTVAKLVQSGQVTLL